MFFLCFHTLKLNSKLCQKFPRGSFPTRNYSAPPKPSVSSTRLTERRVAVFAHLRLQEQEGLAQQQDSRSAQHYHQQAEEDPDDQSDWEVNDAWKSGEDLMQQLQEQQQNEAPITSYSGTVVR